MPEAPGEDDRLAEMLAGRRVLVTGHSGFKGGWLCLWLEHMGAQVVGISLPPPTKPSFYEAVGLDRLIDSRFADIRDPEALGRAASGVDAELVFHLAAQPIVRRSHRFPAETFATNVTGTANVLDIARAMPSLKAVVVVTSDKCYDNRGWNWSYRETDRLGGTDPYSASKAGVINLVQTSANVLYGTGVRVNAICPGLIETGMTRPIYTLARSKGTDDKIGQLNPLKRGGEPVEIAGAALFLASDDSSYVNGQAIVVDGGLSSSHPVGSRRA